MSLGNAVQSILLYSVHSVHQRLRNSVVCKLISLCIFQTYWTQICFHLLTSNLTSIPQDILWKKLARGNLIHGRSYAKPGRTWWGYELFQIYAKLSNVLWLGSSVFNNSKTFFFLLWWGTVLLMELCMLQESRWCGRCRKGQKPSSLSSLPLFTERKC